MKDLLEFKINSLVRKPGEKWINVFNKLIVIFAGWGLSEEFLDKFHYECTETKDFEPRFIQEFVYYALGIRGNPLWNGVFMIYEYIDSGPYDDDYYWRVNITGRVLLEKNNLEKISGKWVFDNYDLVKDFKGQFGDEIYKKLEEISKLFPIKII